MSLNQEITPPKGSHVVYPATRVEGSPNLPGDKSISHRAALFPILAAGTGRITGLSTSVDVLSSVKAATSLGVSFRHAGHENADSQVGLEPLEGSLESLGTQYLEVQGSGHALADQVSNLPITIDCGNSGTTIRLLCGILAGLQGDFLLSGDASLSTRPMRRVAEPLNILGGEIKVSAEGTPPISITGRQLSGGRVSLEIPSAQVLTAIILAGIQSDNGVEVEVEGPMRDHSIRLLKAMNGFIDKTSYGYSAKPSELQVVDVDVPSDISAAAFFLVAAATMPGSRVLLQNLGLNPTRTAILDLLEAYGASVDISEVVEVSGEPRGTVVLDSADRRALNLDGGQAADAIDELPIFAVLACLASGTSSVSGAQELRVKETDRIAVLLHGLAAMGVDAEERPDGFVIRGGKPLKGGVTVDPCGDHRMAMAFSILALSCQEPVTILDPECVQISHPTFFQDLEAVVIR